jgi:hypothetical protein
MLTLAYNAHYQANHAQIPTTLPTLHPLNNDKCDTNVQQPKQAIHLLSPWSPASIATHTLYHVINLVFNNLPSYTISKKLNNSSNRFQ